MYNGTLQKVGIGIESEFGGETGTDIFPGYVFSGYVKEGSNVYTLYGLESNVPLSLSYTKMDVGGSISFIVLSGDFFTIVGRDYFGVQSSYTIDAGVFSGTAPVVYPRRMIGCKCSRLTLNATVDNPLTSTIEWLGQRVITGPEPSGTVYTPVIYTPIGMSVQSSHYGYYTSIQSLDITVNNNLEPQFLANRQAPSPRCCSAIKEGKQEITAKFVTGNMLPPGIRAITSAPYETIGHPLGGFIINIVFVDIFARAPQMTIALAGCYQSSLREPLIPIEAIDFEQDITALSLWVY